LTGALASRASAQEQAAPRWERVRGSAVELALSSAGTAYALDADGRAWRRAPGPASAWSPLPGIFARIDAGPEGEAWAVDRDGAVHRFTGSTWTLVPGRARDVAIGAEGTVYILDATDGAP